MWLPASGVFVLFLCVNPTLSREICPDNVIKDAILSLAHIMRENSQKLDRHEARERQLGDYMKKTMGILAKKVSSLDTLQTNFTKIEDRISGIEQLISQRDERERIQIQKTSDLIENFEKRLEVRLEDIINRIAEVNEHIKPTETPTESAAMSDIISNLNDTKVHVEGQVARIELTLDAMGINNKKEAATQYEKIVTIFTEVQNMSSKLADLEFSLENIQEALQQKNNKPEEPTVNIGEMIEQSMALANVTEFLENTAFRIQDKIQEATTSEVQAALQEAKDALEGGIGSAIDKIIIQGSKNKDEIKDSIGALRSDLANNADHVNAELRNLAKGQVVMVSTADHVLDTKKRVEYGVHQILLEVGVLIKDHSRVINQTLNERFYEISKDIMDNQTEALTNLSNKMEIEMNQVWRQINVMYQQVTESAKSLDQLQQQNKAYVNDSVTTMDGMESKVSDITKRMGEVDANLNFLLGRLSLVTQEFNQIKTGLGTALDNIKASFKEVQKQADDLSHPGPHPVPQDHRELDEDLGNTDRNTEPRDITNSILDLRAN